jgi:hypothetical protein
MRFIPKLVKEGYEEGFVPLLLLCLVLRTLPSRRIMLMCLLPILCIVRLKELKRRGSKSTHLVFETHREAGTRLLEQEMASQGFLVWAEEPAARKSPPS